MMFHFNIKLLKANASTRALLLVSGQRINCASACPMDRTKVETKVEIKVEIKVETKVETKAETKLRTKLGTKVKTK